MIPTIGLIIGFYVLARSWEMFVRERQEKLSRLRSALALTSLLMALIGIVSLVLSSTEVST